jgi:hypothetical protein
MLCLSKTIFVYQFYKILVIEPTTEVNAESIGAPSVKEFATDPVMQKSCNLRRRFFLRTLGMYISTFQH